MTLENRLKWRDASASALPCNGAFGKGVEPVNLRLTPDGGAHVSLGDDWVGLVREFQSFGDVFASTQNAGAVLTQIGRFPAFNLCACGRFATNEHGGLGFDFAEWHRVWATRRTRQKGPWHTISITDRSEATAHQILLLNATEEKPFADLARRFQGVANPNPRWPKRGQGVCTGYIERFQRRKWRLIEAADSGARRLRPDGLPELFEAALADRLRLTVTVVSGPAIQSSLWTPTGVARQDGMVTIASETTQLRLDVSKLAEAWTVPLEVDASGAPAVECYDGQDRLLLGLSAACGYETQWLELLQWLPKA